MLRLETSNSNVRSSVYTYPVDLRNGRACALEEELLGTAEALWRRRLRTAEEAEAI